MWTLQAFPFNSEHVHEGRKEGIVRTFTRGGRRLIPGFYSRRKGLIA